MIVKSVADEDWTSLTNDDNINLTYDQFITKLWDIINQHAPEKTPSNYRRTN